MYYHHHHNYNTTEHILCFYGVIVGQNIHVRNSDVLFIITYGILLYFFSTLTF